MPNVAFITGITGQDDSYLAELLLEKDYTVHGLVHRPDSLGSSNIAHLVHRSELMGTRLILHNGAFEDATHLRRIIARARPTEFYHLAGQSSPRLSLELPETTVDSIGMATLRLLEIVRDISARRDSCMRQVLRSLARRRIRLKTNLPRSIRPLPMVQRKRSPSRWPESIGQPIAYPPAQRFSIITNHHVEAGSSSP